MEQIGWVIGWPLRLLSNIGGIGSGGAANFWVYLLVMLVFWKVAASIYEIFSQKATARSSICERMLTKCRKEIYYKDPKEYESCGMSIYKATHTNAIFPFLNTVLGLLFISMLVFVLYRPLTYFFGLDAGQVQAMFGQDDQIKIIQQVQAGKILASTANVGAVSAIKSVSFSAFGVSIFDPASFTNISIVFPALIILLQLKQLVKSAICIWDKKAEIKKSSRIFRFGLNMFVLLMLLSSSFVLPLFICMEILVWRAGGEIFSLIFRNTIGKKYSSTLKEMEDKCETIICEAKQKLQIKAEMELLKNDCSDDAGVLESEDTDEGGVSDGE